MSGSGGRPVVPPSDLTRGFWDAARAHVLVVQGCTDCGELRHYPQYLCASCLSTQWQWTPLTGRGVVYSFTVSHRSFGGPWADMLPYAVVTVELDEGVRMVSDLPPGDMEHVAIGTQVEVFFDAYDDVTLPRFRIVR